MRRRAHLTAPGKALFGAASFALVLVACGSDHSPGTDTGTGGKAGTGGAATSGSGGGANGSCGASGSTSAAGAGAGGDASACHPSNLSTAPLPCSQDWSHATAKYPTECAMDGGFQARCEPYDAIVYHSGTSNVRCFYDGNTGNLIGARSTDDPAGTGGTCVAFDTSFAEPELAACTALSGGPC